MTVTGVPKLTLETSGIAAHVGVLGGGQLGRMMALAGIPLGMRFRFLDPDPDAPAGDVGELVTASYDDEEALAQFARGLDAVTYEFENVPAAVAGFLSSHCARVFPPPKALEVCQDRLLEKRLFRSVGLGTARFAAVTNAAELRAAIETGAGVEGGMEGEKSAPIGLPCVLKTRRMGYDGKGQAVIRAASEIEGAFERVVGHSKEPALIVESFVTFEREMSLIGVRSGGDGAANSARAETRFYPLVENQHSEGILRLSIAPARGVSAETQASAERLLSRVMDALGYVGVLTVELFEVRDASGRAVLLGNELAPRVHNSGHWTIEGAGTSQFENHLRGVMGWPLGATEMREGSGHAAMVNLIGGPLPNPATVMREGWRHLHLYAKSARPGRKVGHVTVTAGSEAELMRRVGLVR